MHGLERRSEEVQGNCCCKVRGCIIITIYTNLLHFSDVKTPISPCGMCRQFMREFCELDMPVVMVSAGYNSRDFKESVGDHVRTVTLEELLPYSFGPEELDKPREGTR